MKVSLSVAAAARGLWLVTIIAVVVGSLSPSSSFLMRAMARIHVQDKVLHFGAYVLLASFPVLGMRRTFDGFVAAASMALLGVLLEIGQRYVPGRTPDFADELANLLGVAFGMILAFPFRPRYRSGD